jgi:agmatinase
MSEASRELLCVDEALARIASSEARVLIIALPTSRNSSHLKAEPGAPQRIAEALVRDEGNAYAENGADLGDRRNVAYIGALALECDDEFERIRRIAEAVFRAGRMPLFLGGDHSVTYPIIAALHAARGSLPVVHFDAHPDLYDELLGNRLSHASPFARIMENGLASSLWQYGIRTLNPHQREQVARFGVRCHEMRDHASWALPTQPGPIYVSIDLDALDPAFAPGVAHREPGGLSVRQVLDLLARLPGPVVGADVVEYLPQRDVGGITAVVAAKLARELAGMMLDAEPA